MRVTGGKLGGRRLIAPDDARVRPTSDRTRQAIFNILEHRDFNIDFSVENAAVADLFAGTGALGIEAISRGAASVTFVERERRAQDLIADNLERCGITDGYVIIRASVEDALRRLRDRSAGVSAERFDVAFLDPPYDREPAGTDMESVLASAADVMAQGGVLVLEHARRRSSLPVAGRLVRTREVTAGDSALAFYACQP